jgi:alanine racemase
MIKEKVWVELSKANLHSNIAQFRNQIGKGEKLSVAIKANAYGHGIIEVAKISEPLVDFFDVDSINEALLLRNNGITKPILILGYTRLENLEEVVKNDFHQVISTFEELTAIEEIAKKLYKLAKIHLKIETGTNRRGIFMDDLNKFLVHIQDHSNLKLAGISTHFANIEDTTDSTYAFKQLETYKQAVSEADKLGFTDYLKHTACSAAAILYPETIFDMLRLGISLYGLWPSTETLVSAKQKNINIDLQPVLTWKTIVAQIKTLPAGSYISYGCTEKVEEATKIAILPIGYFDGFDRKLSSIGNVLIGGKRCKVLGRVCMNMIVVDVNHLPDVKLEDEVVLLGNQNGQTISAEEIAKKVGTINYEIVARINPTIKRYII